MIRLAYLVSHPIQYQAPLFRALAKEKDITLKVFFCWDAGVKPRFDAGYGTNVAWDIPLLEGYDFEFLSNRSFRPRTGHFWGMINPSAPRRLRAFRPDAVIVHGYQYETTVQTLLSRRFRSEVTLLRGESHLLPPRAPWIKLVKSVTVGPILRGLDGALAVGTLNKAYYMHYGLPESRIAIAPYTVDNAFFRAQTPSAKDAAKTWRAKMRIGEEQTVVLFAGRLVSEKGISDLIEAFGQLGRADSVLVVVGDGPQRPELEAAVKRFSGAQIRFMGFMNQRQISEAYALGNLFVLPSHFEPWGLVVNEAMNFGLPVIVSDQVGCGPDLVSDSNGWTFRASDVGQLSETLSRALDDREGLARRGKESLKRIAEWDIAHTAQGVREGVRMALKQ